MNCLQRSHTSTALARPSILQKSRSELFPSPSRHFPQHQQQCLAPSLQSIVSSSNAFRVDLHFYCARSCFRPSLCSNAPRCSHCESIPLHLRLSQNRPAFEVSNRTSKPFQSNLLIYLVIEPPVVAARTAGRPSSWNGSYRLGHHT